MGNKGEGGVKNFKNRMTSFVMTHCCWFSSIDQIFGKIVHVKIITGEGASQGKVPGLDSDPLLE